MTRKIDLTSLVEGTHCLIDRLGTTVAVATLGTLLLALVPLLQSYFGLSDHRVYYSILEILMLLPLRVYVIPRFLMAIDAHSGHNRLNTPAEWRLRFEERWLRAFLGSVLLGIAIIAGLTLFVIPGVIIFMAFGWSPMRVLLRGESFYQAAKSSLEIMTQNWPKIITAIAAMFLINVVVEVIIFYSSWPSLPRPSLIDDFVRSLFSLWFSTCILFLYHQVESAASLK